MNEYEDNEALALYAKTMRIGFASSIGEDGVRDVLALGFRLFDGNEVRVVLDATDDRLDAIGKAMADIKEYLHTRVPPPGAVWEP